MRRLVAAAVTALAVGTILGVAAAPALAGSDVATQLTVRADSATVDGQAVLVHAELTDAGGKPVPGVLLRLVVPVEFMGATKNEIVDEATTDDAGKAVLSFSPSDVGNVEATVSFWGSHGYAPSDATVPFHVRRPVVSYHPEPAGLQAAWARSYLIPVPFVAVWVTYALVLWLAVRMRRAGRGTEPPARAAKS